MLTFLEKRWNLVFVLFIVIVLASFFYWPAIAQPLMIAMVLITIGLFMLFAVKNHLGKYRAGELDGRQATRNIILEILGILLAATLAVLAGRQASGGISLLIGRLAESFWPGSGAALAILSAVLTALLVGLLVGFVVWKFWGRLIKKPNLS